MDPLLTGSSDGTVSQFWSQRSQKIEELGKTLVGLKQSFSEGVLLRNAFISTRTLEGVEILGEIPRFLNLALFDESITY